MHLIICGLYYFYISETKMNLPMAYIIFFAENVYPNMPAMFVG